MFFPFLFFLFKKRHGWSFFYFRNCISFSCSFVSLVKSIYSSTSQKDFGFIFLYFLILWIKKSLGSRLKPSSIRQIFAFYHIMSIFLFGWDFYLANLLYFIAKFSLLGYREFLIKEIFLQHQTVFYLVVGPCASLGFFLLPNWISKQQLWGDGMARGGAGWIWVYWEYDKTG